MGIINTHCPNCPKRFNCIMFHVPLKEVVSIIAVSPNVLPDEVWVARNVLEDLPCVTKMPGLSSSFLGFTDAKGNPYIIKPEYHEAVKSVHPIFELNVTNDGKPINLGIVKNIKSTKTRRWPW